MICLFVNRNIFWNRISCRVFFYKYFKQNICRCVNYKLFRVKKHLFLQIVFNILQESWKVFIHSVCLSVHALTLVNILQMSWNLYVLFISDVALIVVKMVLIELMDRLQRHTKIFQNIIIYGGSFFLIVYWLSKRCFSSLWITYINFKTFEEYLPELERGQTDRQTRGQTDKPNA